MKLKLIALAILFSSTMAYSQSEFTKIWEMKSQVPNKWNNQNADLSMILMGDLKKIEMIDGTSGKSLWVFDVKKKLGVKSMEDWFFLWAMEGEPVEIVYKKDDDNKVSVYLNSKTGEIENSITESTLKEKDVPLAPSKKKNTIFASAAYDESGTTQVFIDYKDKLFKSALSGTELELKISARGSNQWTTRIKGKCVRHLCTDLLSNDESEMMVNVSVSHGKVFVVYEGITVLDLKTGNVLWNTTFDNVQTSVGLKAKQEIGRSPMPVADDNAVYVCDFSKGEKAIKKLDINTGNEIWRSDKLSGNDVISQLLIVDNTLIAKMGGVIRVEKFIPDANGGIGAGTYKVEYSYEGSSEIRAFDVSSGKQKWTSDGFSNGDKFSKSHCSILNVNNSIVACSDKNFYLLNPSTGTATAKSELGKEIGDPKSIFIYKDNYIVQGDEGIASFKSSGAKNYSESTDKCFFTEFRGDAFIVWIGKSIDDLNEFIRFDLDSGKISGKLKGTYRPRFDTTGDYFIRFKDETVTKFTTK
ncbi:MAG TPA: PQQ-binding-like beta-propeller repeat protein [Bacteroidia bacterium]|nr:PQQ-binding-like beta-propeller repeat protein [Bacteroidia bacterium]